MNISCIVRDKISATVIASKGFCPSCGGRILSQDNFCPSCGFSLEESGDEDESIENIIRKNMDIIDRDECTYPENPRGPGGGLGRYAGQRVGRGIGIRNRRNPSGFEILRGDNSLATADTDIVVSDEDVHVTVRDVKNVLKSLRKRSGKKS